MSRRPRVNTTPIQKRRNRSGIPGLDRERFLSFVEKSEGGCWLWTGRRDKDGYGVFGAKRNGKNYTWRAHRFALAELAGVDVDNDLVTLHSCDNPPCVNPAHLSLGTNLDNIADRQRKGRTPVGSQAGAAKLTEADIVLIREATGTLKSIGERFGVSLSSIHLIKKAKIWRHVPAISFEVSR